MLQYAGERRRLTALVCVAFVLTACGGDDGDEAPPPGSSTPPPSTNSPSAPTLNGSPKKQAKVGETYTFQPAASGANGSGALSFSVSSKPAWLAFDTSNGRLTGTPTAGDVGLYEGIRIQASNNGGTAALQPFSIEVVDIGQTSVTLSWLPPTLNEDGTPLNDLAGYKIRYGEDAGDYPLLIDVNNPGITTYVVDGLVPSKYYFVISAYNSVGLESDYSNEAEVILGGT